MMSSALRELSIRYAACQSRNCRFISTSNSLNCVPRKSKIVSDKKITPREYHDDKVTETASENPHQFSSTRAILGPRVDALGTGFVMPQAARPKYEKQSIWCSMMVFMLYFFVFREENDVDLYIANISDPNLAGLEMKKTIKNFKKEGKDTAGMESSYVAWEAEQERNKKAALEAA